MRPVGGGVRNNNKRRNSESEEASGTEKERKWEGRSTQIISTSWNRFNNWVRKAKIVQKVNEMGREIVKKVQMKEGANNT